MSKILFAVTTAILSLAAITSGQQPGTPASIAISPASIEAKVRPGSIYTQNFVVTNSTDAPLKLRMSLNDVGYDQNDRRINGRPGTLERSASTWISFDPAEAVLKPRGAQVVKAVITVPAGVTGSFYTAPVFEAMPVGNVVNSDAALSSASIGIKFRGLMLLTTESGSEYNIEIVAAQALAPTPASELKLMIGLRNRGTALARVRGAFALIDRNGGLAGKGTIPEKRFLPGQKGEISAAWAGELRPGTYTCIVTLSYDRVGLAPISMAHEMELTVK